MEAAAAARSEDEEALALRKARKRAILEWQRDFEEKNGGKKPTRADKESVRHIFVAFQQADRAVHAVGHLAATAPAMEEEGQELLAVDYDQVGSYADRSYDMAKLVKRKRMIKGNIRSWLEAFRQKHGKDASTEEKEEIRHLYTEYKSLGLRIAALEAASSAKRSESTKVLTDAASSGGMSQAKFARRDSQSEKVASMRQRFLAMKESLAKEEGEWWVSPSVSPRVSPRTERKPGDSEKAKKRWSLVSRVVSPTQKRVRETSSPTATVGGKEREDQVIEIVKRETDGEDLDWVDEPQSAQEAEEMFAGSPLTLPRPSAAADLEKVILSLRDAAASVEIPSYGTELTESTEKDEIIVSRIPVEEVRRREVILQKERMRRLQAEAQEYTRRESDIAFKEEGARRRIMALEEVSQKRVAEEREWEARQRVLRRWALSQTFTRARLRLEAALAAQKSALRERMGRLAPGERVAGRRFELRWRGMPQPIEVRAHMVRDVKDKLPKGRYVLLLSMADRLGGRPLQWTKLAEGYGMGAHPAATRPVHHSGRYSDRELRVEQSMFQLCPSKRSIRPSNIFIVELFQLVGPRNAMDRVVAWGVLPMCDSKLRMVRGKFKIPLLRGDVDPSIRLYSQLEHQLSTDLSCWMANLYLEVRALPRRSRGPQAPTEFDVEYDHVNKILRLPETESTQREMHRRHHSLFGGLPPPDSTNKINVERRPTSTGNDSQAQEVWWRRVAPIFSAEHADKAPLWPEEGCYDSDDDLEKGTGVSYLHGGGDGAHSRGDLPRVLADGARWDPDGLGCAGPSKDSEGTAAHWQPLRHEYDLKEYGYGVFRDLCKHDEAATSSKIVRQKLVYIRQELTHIIPQRWSDLDWWLGLVVVLTALWSRMYLHFLGQWLYLQALQVPLYAADPFVYQVSLKYLESSVSTGQEIGMVIVGPLFVIVCFAGLLSVGRTLQLATGTLTEPISKFIAGFGAGAVVDPLLIFFVDWACGNYNCRSKCAEYTSPSCHCHEGDAWKLAWRMEILESNGVTGAILTAFIYFESFLLSMVMLYWYLLNMHLDGHMLDVWRRANARSEDCFVPHDEELSRNELTLICSAASRWVGPKGARREVVETEGWERGVSRRVRIFQRSPESESGDGEGSQELHRQFIESQQSGAILEVVPGREVNI